LEPEFGDLALLVCGFAQFGCGVVVEAGLEEGENLGGGFAGGAEEEDAAKALLVKEIGFGEGGFGGGIGGDVGEGLLLLLGGPLQGLGRGVGDGFCLTEAGMAVEGLKPVSLGQRPPDG
jgi:hypothetical protein